MKNRPPKQNEQRPPRPPIRIGRVTFRDGALDLDEDFAVEIRRCVATRDEALSRALGCLMSLEDLDDAATRCAKYLEQAMHKGDHAAVERFASLLFAIDVTAKAHGDELAASWPPGRSSAADIIARAPVGESGLVGPDDAAQAENAAAVADVAMSWDGQPIDVNPASGEFSSTSVDEDAEAEAAAELAAQREALVRGRDAST